MQLTNFYFYDTMRYLLICHVIYKYTMRPQETALLEPLTPFEVNSTAVTGGLDQCIDGVNLQKIREKIVSLPINDLKMAERNIETFLDEIFLHGKTYNNDRTLGLSVQIPLNMMVKLDPSLKKEIDTYYNEFIVTNKCRDRITLFLNKLVKRMKEVEDQIPAKQMDGALGQIEYLFFQWGSDTFWYD